MTHKRRSDIVVNHHAQANTYQTASKGETLMPKGGTKRTQLERNRRIKEAEAKRKATRNAVKNPDDEGNGRTKPTCKHKGCKERGLTWFQRMSDRRKDAVIRGKRDPFYRHRKAKLVATVAGIALMVLASGAGIYGLVSGVFGRATSTNNWQRTGMIAANVMGDNVMEDTITEQIMSVRKNYADDTAWAQYLVDNDKTPSELRDSVISRYKSSIILKHALKDNNLPTSLTQAQIDQWWDENKDAYESHGVTKEMAASRYADTIRRWVLMSKIVPVDSVTDQDVLDYVNEHESTYNGARRSRHILFAADTEGSTSNMDQAESVREQIVSGESSFDDAVSTYSTDTGTKGSQGDVGWDCDSSLVAEYETALKALGKGDVSQVTQTRYGYHVIQCTDVFTWNGTLTDTNAIPDEIKESVRSMLQRQRFDEWYSEYASDAQVTINDMPSGLPYDVSLDGITKSENANNGTSTVTTNEDSTVTTTTTTSSDDSNATDNAEKASAE